MPFQASQFLTQSLNNSGPNKDQTCQMGELFPRSNTKSTTGILLHFFPVFLFLDPIWFFRKNFFYPKKNLTWTCCWFGERWWCRLWRYGWNLILGTAIGFKSSHGLMSWHCRPCGLRRRRWRRFQRCSASYNAGVVPFTRWLGIVWWWFSRSAEKKIHQQDHGLESWIDWIDWITEWGGFRNGGIFFWE